MIIASKATDCLSDLYIHTSKCTYPIVQVHELYLLKLLAMSPKSTKAIATCLSAVYYGYLQSAMTTCSLLWLPVLTMDICGLLWLPVLYYAWLPAVYFGYLKSTMATCSLLIAT